MSPKRTLFLGAVCSGPSYGKAKGPPPQRNHRALHLSSISVHRQPHLQFPPSDTASSWPPAFLQWFPAPSSAQLPSQGNCLSLCFAGFLLPSHTCLAQHEMAPVLHGGPMLLSWCSHSDTLVVLCEDDSFLQLRCPSMSKLIPSKLQAGGGETEQGIHPGKGRPHDPRLPSFKLSVVCVCDKA